MNRMYIGAKNSYRRCVVDTSVYFLKKVIETFASFTSLVKSAICSLSKILLLTKERASTPVIYAPWLKGACAAMRGNRVIVKRHVIGDFYLLAVHVYCSLIVLNNCIPAYFTQEKTNLNLIQSGWYLNILILILVNFTDKVINTSLVSNKVKIKYFSLSTCF